MLCIRIPTDQELLPLAQRIGRDRAWVSHICRQRRRQQLHLLAAAENGQLIGFITYSVTRNGWRTRRTWGAAVVQQIFQHLSAGDPATLLLDRQVGLLQEFGFASQQHQAACVAALVQRWAQNLASAAVNELQIRLTPDDKAMQQQLGALGFQPTRLLVHRQLTTAEGWRHSGSRPATWQDLPQLAALVRREVYEQQRFAGYLPLAPAINWERYVAAKLRRRDRQLLVSEQDGQLVGYVELWLPPARRRSFAGRLRAAVGQLWRVLMRCKRDVSPPSPMGIIEDIYIAPAFRQSGFSTALLQAALAWFDSRQVTRIHGSIWQANTTSLRFFQKHGFAVAEIVMSKLLTVPPAHQKGDC